MKSIIQRVALHRCDRVQRQQSTWTLNSHWLSVGCERRMWASWVDALQVRWQRWWGKKFCVAVTSARCTFAWSLLCSWRRIKGSVSPAGRRSLRRTVWAFGSIIKGEMKGKNSSSNRLIPILACCVMITVAHGSSRVENFQPDSQVRSNPSSWLIDARPKY